MEFFYQVSHPFQADVVANVRKVGFIFVRQRLVYFLILTFLNRISQFFLSTSEGFLFL